MDIYLILLASCLSVNVAIIDSRAEETNYELELYDQRLLDIRSSVDSSRIININDNGSVNDVVHNFFEAIMAPIWSQSVCFRPFLRIAGLDVIDTGGVWRSYSNLISNSVFDANYALALRTRYFMGPLLVRYPNSVAEIISQSESCLKFFEGFGRYLLLTIVHDGQFPRNIAKFVLKYILSESLCYQDFICVELLEEYSWLSKLHNLTIDTPHLFSNNLQYGCPLEEIYSSNPFNLTDTTSIEFSEEYILLDDMNEKLMYWKYALLFRLFITKSKRPLDAIKKGFRCFDRQIFNRLQLTSQMLFARHYPVCESYEDLINNFELQDSVPSDAITDQMKRTIKGVFQEGTLNDNIFPGITAADICTWITGK